ncbi:thiamin biosynthesis protein [Actinocatenispora thailandica]|uniref:Thiamin biosynthesis protein n=2 Tax=Actinocatenispora thailandica TaxID=227318 RepID=A0A7R7HYB4_9ACTN|nr:thiamin biosynthesis protein [Actinocatenispora thailandica]
MLLPTVTPLHRDRRSIQVGLSGAHSLVLHSGRSSVDRLLRLLDGRHTETSVRHEASRLGFDAHELDRLLCALTERGLLRDASSLLPGRLAPATRRRLESEAAALSMRLPSTVSPARALAHRRRARVLLVGRSRLTAPTGALLAAAGVGRLHPIAAGVVAGADPAVGGVLPDDARRPWRRAVCDAILRAAPETDTRALTGPDADLIILFGRPRPTPPFGYGQSLRSVRHLSVWVRDEVVLVGPLVRPGRTSCLRCVELARADRDRCWPVLAAQLATMPGPVPEPVDAPLLAAGAALAAAQALQELDGGDPDTLGGTLELPSPGVVRRRSWPPHPRCGCLRVGIQRRA